MLNLGLIGLGPEWESRYRPALSELSERVRVKAVYDAVAERAVQAAEELEAAPVAGLRALLQRKDVRAVLVLDAAWHRLWPLRFAVAQGKPAFVTNHSDLHFDAIDSLHAAARDARVLLMPELRLRATPGAMRVRELTATKLGLVQHLRVDVSEGWAGDAAARLIAVVDWCADVVQSTVVSIDRTAAKSQDELQLTAAFRRPAAGGAPVLAEIRFPLKEPTSDAAEPAGLEVSAQFACAHGSIALKGSSRLRWETVDERADEELVSERPSSEVLLVHFARKVLGGLVPVPDLSDISRAGRLLAAVLADLPRAASTTAESA